MLVKRLTGNGVPSAPGPDVYLWRLLFDRDSYTKESVAGGPGVAGHTETGHTERGHTETGHMEAGR